MHPRVLVVAELLCYVVGSVLVTRGVLSGLGAMTVVSGFGLLLAGVSLAGELTLGWFLALGACALGAWSGVDHLIRDPAIVVASPRTIDVAVVVVLAGLLVHRETREQRIRFFR